MVRTQPGTVNQPLPTAKKMVWFYCIPRPPHVRIANYELRITNYELGVVILRCPSVHTSRN